MLGVFAVYTIRREANAKSEPNELNDTKSSVKRGGIPRAPAKPIKYLLLSNFVKILNLYKLFLHSKYNVSKYFSKQQTNYKIVSKATDKQ